MRSIATQIARQLPTDTRSDGDLLSGFLTAGTQAEADFGELVRRHGPLVWGVCRRALPDAADAEDAFQAVFLVLVRRANRLKTSSTIAPWLYRVATWTARNVRRRNTRQRARRVPLPDQLTAPHTDPDLTLDLDAALLSLPEKYRSPVVMCHLLGFSRAAAAERLGCPEGTLSAWLSRGLSKLRVKLVGLDPAKLLGVAATAVPAGVATSAVKAALASHVAVTATAAISSTVSQLVEGVIHMFWVKKATAAACTLFAVFALGVGVGVSTRQVVADANGQDKAVAAATDQPAKPNDVDRAKKILDLEQQIVAAKETLNATNSALKVAKEYAAFAREASADPKTLQDSLEKVAKFQKRADEAAANLKRLTDELEKLKAAQAASPAPSPPRKADSERQLLDLLTQLATLREDRALLMKESAEKALELEKRIQDLTEAYKTLQLQAMLDKNAAPATKSAAYVELTLHGKEAWFEYSIRETDANGKEIGRVITREPEMLLKLLTRVKADATAPKELRVIADPSIALSSTVITAFKACDAAGFAKVKFTGYMPKGTMVRELKSDQKGEVKGFKRYDNTEISPSSLIVAMEEWMNTW